MSKPSSSNSSSPSFTGSNIFSRSLSLSDRPNPTAIRIFVKTFLLLFVFSLIDIPDVFDICRTKFIFILCLTPWSNKSRIWSFSWEVKWARSSLWSISSVNCFVIWIQLLVVFLITYQESSWHNCHQRCKWLDRAPSFLAIPCKLRKNYRTKYDDLSTFLISNAMLTLDI